MIEGATVGAYIHIPFCENKCDYCDFYSIVAGDRERENYIQALQQEISRSSNTATRINSIYLGGGSPGLLTPNQLERLVQTIDEHYVLSNNSEITLECNPENANEEKLKAFRQAGVNRISLGIQSFDRTLLKVLGRQRDKDPDESIEIALRVFPKTSLDLMVGIPGQTAKNIQHDFERIPQEIGHLSIYELTLYPQTRLTYRVEKGLVKLNDDNVSEELDNVLVENLQSRGFSQYEVSNYSRQGERSRHNLHYWQYDDYFGFGASAVSSWDGTRTTNTTLGRYLLGDYISEREVLPIPTQKLEWLMMNLRLTEGFLRGRYKERFGMDALDDFPEPFEKYARYFYVLPERIALTPEGLRFHQTVLSEFVP